MKTIRILSIMLLTLVAHNVQAQIDTIDIFRVEGVHEGGALHILYCLKNPTAVKEKNLRMFVNPLIIAEGYDACKVLGQPNMSLASIKRENEALISELQTVYDVIYLDYGDGVDDIFNNARLLEEAIDTVNARNISLMYGEFRKNVVMGVSMGGLVARYCLASMEQKGKDHQTRKFISVDAPHKGANVPVGFQAAVRDLHKYKYKFKISLAFLEMAAEILSASLADPHIDAPVNIDIDLTTNTHLQRANDLLNRPASRQMLIYYVNDNSQIDNSVHEAFMQEYERVGFPKQCLNVAAANGNGFGQRLLGEGQMLFRLGEDGCTAFSAEVSLGLAAIEANAEIYAKTLNNEWAAQVYQNKITAVKKFC
jgi:pimeloyl-ACP methyl ester carboxylesterase